MTETTTTLVGVISESNYGDRESSSITVRRLRQGTQKDSFVHVIADNSPTSIPIQPPATSPLAPRQRLDRHFALWLGHWPPQAPLEVIVAPGLDLPGWDGGTWQGAGIQAPDETLIALSPSLRVNPATLDLTRLREVLAGPRTWSGAAEAIGVPGLGVGRPVFRWCEAVTDLPEIGEWVPRDDPRVPAWLRVFNGDVLIVCDAHGHYAAGVGRKQHTVVGHELSVGTEPAYRGRGYASKLVAQAARRVLAEGAVPLYLHGRENPGSARVADLAGFPDRGWHLLHFRMM